jgi:hypothetical protein
MKRLFLILASAVSIPLICFGLWFYRGSDPYAEITDLRLTMPIDKAMNHLGNYCYVNVNTSGTFMHVTAESSKWWQENKYYSINLKFKDIGRSNYILSTDPTVIRGSRSEEFMNYCYEQWDGYFNSGSIFSSRSIIKEREFKQLRGFNSENR